MIYLYLEDMKISCLIIQMVNIHAITYNYNYNYIIIYLYLYFTFYILYFYSVEHGSFFPYPYVIPSQAKPQLLAHFFLLQSPSEPV